jgi:hypothetical protein
MSGQGLSFEAMYAEVQSTYISIASLLGWFVLPLVLASSSL